MTDNPERHIAFFACFNARVRFGNITLPALLIMHRGFSQPARTNLRRQITSRAPMTLMQQRGTFTRKDSK